MVSPINDPVYQGIASSMAGQLGGGSSMTAALLAQIQCEKAGLNPYQDNNPLNVHVDAMASVGITGLPHGIGDFGACASFATLQDGANAAVELLQRASRYRACIADAAADNGPAYLRDVTSAGWGTSYSCAAGYLAQLAGSSSNASATGSTAGTFAGAGLTKGTAGGSGSPSSGVSTASAIELVTGKSASDPLASSDIDTLASYVSHLAPGILAGIAPAVVGPTLHLVLDGSVGKPIGQISTPIPTPILQAIEGALTEGGVGAIVTGAAQATGAQPTPNPIGDVANAITNGAQVLAQTLVQLLVYGAIVLGILVVGYLGVRQLASS